MEPWPEARLARATDLSERARALLNYANPWVRERKLRHVLGCSDADQVALRIDLCCTSWERTLVHALGAPGMEPRFATVMVPLLALVCSTEPPTYWRGVVIPVAARYAPVTEDEASEHQRYAKQLADAGLVLWAVATWRVAASHALEEALDLHTVDDGTVTPQNEEHAALAYDMVLFRDTQLDLLAHLTRTRKFSDESVAVALIDGDGTGASLYPDCLHVLCIEELPDMSAVLALVNIWYDSGIRKTREGVLEALAHVMCKMMNQKCQMRDLRKLVLDYSDRYPAFNRLFKLLLQVAILGNLPRAEARLDWAARIRIACLFRAERGPQGVSTPLSRSCFGPWMRVALYPLMFALREVLVYAIERDSVLSDIMDENMRWHQHVRIVRAANGDMRRVLSHQAAYRPAAPFDWLQLQRTELNSNGKPKKVGVTMSYHDAGLKANSKMRKAPFEVIVLKEMTSCHTLYGARVSFDDAAVFAELARVDEALHICAWAAAREKETIIPTRYLPLIGMTPAGYARVRRWFFEYYVYDVSDHGYVDELLALHADEPLDWVRLRAYIIRVMQFRDEGNIFYLPMGHVRSQLRALRERALVDDWEDTPSHLGVALRCPECDSWATPVVEPPVTFNADGEATSAAHTGVKRRIATAANKDSAPDAYAAPMDDDYEAAERDAIEMAEAGIVDDDARDAAALETVAELQRDEQRKKTADRLQKRVAQSMYMSAVWYDPATNNLHCRRRHRRDTGPLAALFAQLDAMEDSGGESDDDDDEEHPKKRKKGKAVAPVAHDAAADDGNDMEDDDDTGMRDMRALSISSLSRANKATLDRLAAYAERATRAVRTAEPEKAVAEPAAPARAVGAARKPDPVDAYLVRHFHREYNRVLTPINAVGVWVTTHNGVFGLCNECGVMTQVENNRITNDGVSCLHHVTSNMRDDNPVRLLLEARDRRRAGIKPPKPGTELSRRSLALSRPLGLKPTPVRDDKGAIALCFYCQHHAAEYQILAYDRTVQLWRVPLCQMHYKASQRTLQTALVPSVAALLDVLVASRW